MDPEARGTRGRLRGAARTALFSTLGPARTQAIRATYGRGLARWQLRVDPILRRSNADLRAMRDAHLGQTAVIIGNGPSINATNMALLRDVPTFGLNRIYLKFDELGYETTFHVCVNDLVMRQCANEIAALGSQKFCDRRAFRLLGAPDRSRFTYLRTVPAPFFATDPTITGLWQGGTVTFVAMQLAYLMGFTRVLLVGVDHRFVTRGEPHKAVVSSGRDKDHFAPNYFGEGFEWHLPDLEMSEMAYRLARDAYEEAGREIVDCTVDGALTIFRKSSLEVELR